MSENRADSAAPALHGATQSSSGTVPVPPGQPPSAGAFALPEALRQFLPRIGEEPSEEFKEYMLRKVREWESRVGPSAEPPTNLGSSQAAAVAVLPKSYEDALALMPKQRRCLLLAVEHHREELMSKHLGKDVVLQLDRDGNLEVVRVYEHAERGDIDLSTLPIHQVLISLLPPQQQQATGRIEGSGNRPVIDSLV
ncbi:MAG: hypothetical protein BJ554DRAFT_841, partial [Olpidium bornovanus]